MLPLVRQIFAIIYIQDDDITIRLNPCFLMLNCHYLWWRSLGTLACWVITTIHSTDWSRKQHLVSDKQVFYPTFSQPDLYIYILTRHFLLRSLWCTLSKSTMSRSQARVSLPSISIPQNILQDQQLLSFVISDLAALIAAWDDIVDDLLSYTDAKAPDVRNLWVEAIMSIEAFRRVWIEPLQQKIQDTSFGAVSGIGSSNILASIKGKQPALKQRYDQFLGQFKAPSIKMAFLRYKSR